MSRSVLEDGSLAPGIYTEVEAALAGQYGELLRGELRQLVAECYLPRAHRSSARVIAKLLRVVEDQELEDTVIVRDVSTSGMRVTFPASLAVDLFEACAPRFRLRLGQAENARVADVNAVLVRVTSRNAHGVNLAYRFEGLGDAERALIHELEHCVVPESARLRDED